MNTTAFLQILVGICIILALARLCGSLMERFGQPSVVGEIIAGILLGPSLLGLISPSTMAFIFPENLQPAFYLLSQIGLIFFMFLVGLELDPRRIRGRVRSAVLISNASVFLPFVLGLTLSHWLWPANNMPSVPWLSFALFAGAAMSVTAFPVLARILEDLKLQQTRLGSLALACASVDDVTAWTLLAISIAVARFGNPLDAIPTIIGIIVYAAFMLTVGRAAIGALLRRFAPTGETSANTLTAVFIAVLLSAVITQAIGIDVIFGGFILGAILPKDNAIFTENLRRQTHQFVSVFLLPIFFAYSGLHTEIGLLNTPYLLLLCALVIAAACLGKFAGAYVPARMSGVSPREATALGWLMNTRGLTELVVLNIGLQMQILSPTMFAIFVLMALATTFVSPWLMQRAHPAEEILRDDADPVLRR